MHTNQCYWNTIKHSNFWKIAAYNKQEFLSATASYTTNLPGGTGGGKPGNCGGGIPGGRVGIPIGGRFKWGGKDILTEAICQKDSKGKLY